MSRWQVDKSLLLIVFFFLGLGLVQIYSSSFILAMEKYGDGLYIFRRQLIFTGLGVLALLMAMELPMKWFRRLIPFFLVGNNRFVIADLYSWIWGQSRRSAEMDQASL